MNTKGSSYRLVVGTTTTFDGPASHADVLSPLLLHTSEPEVACAMASGMCASWMCGHWLPGRGNYAYFDERGKGEMTMTKEAVAPHLLLSPRLPFFHLVGIPSNSCHAPTPSSAWWPAALPVHDANALAGGGGDLGLHGLRHGGIGRPRGRRTGCHTRVVRPR